jgi:hypothetical protein
VKALEELEHRTIVVFEETVSDAHLVVGRDADQIVIECPVVN